MRDAVSRFGTALFLARTRDILLATAHRGFVLLQLLLQLRNFQHREKLALFYVRAPIHVKFLDISGNLGVDVHLLKGQEFRSDLQSIGEVAALHLHHGCTWRLGGVFGSGAVRAAAAGEKTPKKSKCEE